MGSAGIHINGKQTLTRGDEQTISLRSAKAQIAGRLRKFDQTNALSLRIENMDAVKAIAYPSSTGPNVAMDITAKAI